MKIQTYKCKMLRMWAPCFMSLIVDLNSIYYPFLVFLEVDLIFDI